MGERDVLVGEHNVRTIAKIVPALKLVKLPCSHLVLQCQPRAAAIAIGEFMASRQAELREYRSTEPAPKNTPSVSIKSAQDGVDI